MKLFAAGVIPDGSQCIVPYSANAKPGRTAIRVNGVNNDNTSNVVRAPRYTVDIT